MMETGITQRLLTAAAAYVSRGWHVFTLSPDKVPFRNCGECQPGRCPGGQGPLEGSACGHLVCHGFYAATLDMERVERMVHSVLGRCALAVRTGQVSGLAVLDAEGDARDGSAVPGVDVLDEFEVYTDGVNLPDTLRAVTSGGGVHLFYRLEPGQALRGANRVLPNVDLKADGGYVVCPPAAGRRWLNWGTAEAGGVPATTSQELLDWMGRQAGTCTGGAQGRPGSAGPSLKDLEDEDGTVPGGRRYEYMRGLVYKLRKTGVERTEAHAACKAAWARFAQPPHARYELPWSQFEYELDRAWTKVSPEEPLSHAQLAWAKRVSGR